MTNNTVPLLTAEKAYYEVVAHSTEARNALDAIADGRAVVVPRMSESEAREAFVEKYGDDFVERRGTCELVAWLAALRFLNAIRPDGQEGV